MNTEEIKYKVLIKSDNEIYPVDFMAFWSAKSANAGGVFNVQYRKGAHPKMVLLPSNRAVLLRYTGVTCKNGESYEGDKVEIRPLSYNPDYPPLGGIIIWDELSWQIQTTSNDFYPEVRHFPLGDYDPQIIKIVGNVHLKENNSEKD